MEFQGLQIQGFAILRIQNQVMHKAVTVYLQSTLFSKSYYIFRYIALHYSTNYDYSLFTNIDRTQCEQLKRDAAYDLTIFLYIVHKYVHSVNVKSEL